MSDLKEPVENGATRQTRFPPANETDLLYGHLNLLLFHDPLVSHILFSVEVKRKCKVELNVTQARQPSPTWENRTQKTQQFEKIKISMIIKMNSLSAVNWELFYPLP